MDDWGYNPDVALFVGGPKDGTYEDIGGVKTIVIQEPVADLWSFSDPSPIFLTNRYTYIRGTVALGGAGGTTATVMYDQTWNLMRVTRRAEDQWIWDQKWRNPQFNQAMKWFNGVVDFGPPKSPEEATAWLRDGKGKDFL